MVSVRYLFYQPMDGKIKTWTLRFPAKENPNMEKALFDWPIVLQYDVKPKYQLISRKFSGVKSFHPTVRLTNQKPRTFCIRSTNQSNRSISVRLLLLCCSRVFISRSYENRSIGSWVIGSSKKIAGSKVTNSFYCTVNILITFYCRNVKWKLKDAFR